MDCQNGPQREATCLALIPIASEHAGHESNVHWPNVNYVMREEAAREFFKPSVDGHARNCRELCPLVFCASSSPNTSGIRIHY